MNRFVGLENVMNCRDMGGVVTEDGKTVHRGVAYRSACPWDPTEGDVKKLFGDLNIETVIDLRTTHECVKRPFPPKPKNGFVKPTNAKYYNVSLISSSLMQDALYPHCDTTTQWKANILYYVGLGPLSDLIIWKSMNEIGIRVFYDSILDHQQKLILEVLSLFLHPSSHYPLLFCCSAGRDRTGIIAALLYGALGVSHKDIVKDYVMTNEGIRPFLDDYMHHCKKWNLVHPDWLTCHPDVMSHFLNHIDETYGGIVEYLSHIGFGEVQVKQLRKTFLEPRD